MENKKISRRKFLPILGGTAFLPFLGFGKSNQVEKKGGNLKTLLRADGTSVQVDESVLKNAKIVKKGVSNQSLLEWLNPASKK